MNQWVTHKEKVETLMKEAKVVRLALCNGSQPYLVPVNFGMSNGKLYFHSGNRGSKVAILAQNPQIAFEMDADVDVVRKPEACKWSMRYRSIVGTGSARLLTEPAEKEKGLDHLMEHHAPGESFPYDAKMMAAVNVYEIQVETLRYRESDGS
ncbi:MAG: pyridoxamine 5'-phosphate oxidase family protein [Bacillota bacterium]|nr:pyridoxamine 5'-phosphate oxidase family protein [Bacillota bacterium]MDW7677238.1 pyridoxamine 5'-phosphate oxidase family protein [Bacillota bacterium]